MHGTSQDISSGVPDYCGELMSYRLKYGIFNIGWGSISCLEDPEGEGGTIRAEAQSSGWIKIFKDLNYLYESNMDLATGLPNYATINLIDGRYTTHYEVTFDHHSRIDSAIVYSKMSGQHVVPRNIFDILTGFYHFRKIYLSEDMVEGEEVVIKTYFTDELWDLRIRYVGEETIKTKYGDLVCYKYNPITVIGRYFQNDDDMSIWFTKTECPIPVKIRVNLKFGHVILECVDYQNPGFSFSDSDNKE